MSSPPTRKPSTAHRAFETLCPDESKRPNIPTAEFQWVLQKEDQDPVHVAYERREMGKHVAAVFSDLARHSDSWNGIPRERMAGYSALPSPLLLKRPLLHIPVDRRASAYLPEPGGLRLVVWAPE